MAKMLHNGRSKERFVKLPYSLLESDAFKSLPGGAVQIYLEIRRRFNGSNNGEISLSYREAAEVARCSKSKAKELLDTLQSHGLVAIRYKGKMRNRNATTWFLTMEHSQLDSSYPTNTWRNFRREPNQEATSDKTKSAVPAEERLVPNTVLH